MPDREFHYHWQYDLDASPEALWPLVANTDRFDRDIGLPALQEDPPDPSRGKRRLSFRHLGMKVAWEEEPFEWLRPERFGVRRLYQSGPLSELRVLAELHRSDKGGTHLTYQIWARPRNWFGRIVIPLQIGLISARRFEHVFRQYDAALAQAQALPKSRIQFQPGVGRRLADIAIELQSQGVDKALVQSILEVLLSADDMDVFRLRPYMLADLWGLSRHAVLSAFLHGTRAGLLDLRWELLCPMCRGAKQAVSSLAELSSQIHCDACHIDFTANFDRLVELVFSPNPGIRKLQVGQYCVGSPQLTPHIVLQQCLGTGAKQELSVQLEPGRHRLRTSALPGGRMMSVEPGGMTRLGCEADKAGWPTDEPVVDSRVELSLHNRTADDQLFILERMAWNDQAATAADVTSLQVFRDLFSSQALRPGEQFSVGTVTIVFTDLCDSTRLYRRIGDAPAFGCVMSHFDVLREAIARHDGAIVKTIGDAVMAVFTSSACALRAVAAAQAVLRRQDASRPALQLKAGVHRGPCIAVTLNDRLDYFGSTVNLAARLAGAAKGEHVVISSAVYEDPEVTACLADETSRFDAVPIEAELKGFDDQPFKLWRLECTQVPAEAAVAQPRARNL